MPSLAQTPKGYNTILIDNFAQAVKNNDEDNIAATWAQLNADAQAKEYMDANNPVVAADFRLTQTIIESTYFLIKFNKNYPGPVEFPQRPQLPSFFKQETNADTVIRKPNNLEPTIQETTRQQLNAPPPDNQTTAANLPNQNQQSNQNRIQGQLNRLRQTTP